MSDPRKQEILFNTESLTGTSRVVHVRNQVTFKGAGMQEGDVVYFYIVNLKPGEFDKWCQCQFVPGKLAEVESITPLMCDTCDADGNKVQVQMTRDNPVVVLDAPQDSLVQLIYEGDGFKTSTVIAIHDTNTKDLTPAMRGCPAICPEPNWHDTGRVRSNLETGKKECEETDDLGHYRWVECGDLVWRPTGAVRSTEEGKYECEETDDLGDYRWVECGDVDWWQTGMKRAGADDKVECQEVNKLGELRWVECGDIAWTRTSKTILDDAGEKILCEEINQLGQIRWAECGDVEWVATGVRRPNADGDKIECQETNGFGGLRWVECGDIEWTPTGVCRPSDEFNSVECQETDGFGNYRWGEPVQAEWAYTGDKECKVIEEDFKYQIRKKYVNQVGQVDWRVESTKYDMQPTGIESCVDGYINVQLTTPCGDIAWKKTDKQCVPEPDYFATVPLPGGGKMYRDGQQDPDASVALTDCDGTVLGYIYPEPRAGATTEVFAGCGEDAVLLGYAVDGEGTDACSPCAGGCDVGSTAGMSFPDSIDIGNLPSEIDVNIKSLPPLAMSVFENCGYKWVLWSDGQITRIEMECHPDKPEPEPEPERKFRLSYDANGFDLIPPFDVNEYSFCALATVKDWQGAKPEGYDFLGWAETPNGDVVYIAGDTVQMCTDITLYAKWCANITFDDGLGGYKKCVPVTFTAPDDATDLPEDLCVDVGECIDITQYEPKREGYLFAGWVKEGETDGHVTTVWRGIPDPYTPNEVHVDEDFTGALTFDINPDRCSSNSAVNRDFDTEITTTLDWIECKINLLKPSEGKNCAGVNYRVYYDLIGFYDPDVNAENAVIRVNIGSPNTVDFRIRGVSAQPGVYTLKLGKTGKLAILHVTQEALDNLANDEDAQVTVFTNGSFHIGIDNALHDIEVKRPECVTIKEPTTFCSKWIKLPAA